MKDDDLKVENSEETTIPREQRIDEEVFDDSATKKERNELKICVAGSDCRTASDNNVLEETEKLKPKNVSDEADTKEVKNESTCSRTKSEEEPVLAGPRRINGDVHTEHQATNNDRLQKNMKGILRKLIEEVMYALTEPTGTGSNANAADIAEDPTALGNLSMLGQMVMEEVKQKSGSSDSDRDTLLIFNYILGALGSLNLHESESAEVLECLSAIIPVPHEIVSMVRT